MFANNGNHADGVAKAVQDIRKAEAGITSPEPGVFPESAEGALITEVASVPRQEAASVYLKVKALDASEHKASMIELDQGGHLTVKPVFPGRNGHSPDGATVIEGTDGTAQVKGIQLGGQRYSVDLGDRMQGGQVHITGDNGEAIDLNSQLGQRVSEQATIDKWKYDAQAALEALHLTPTEKRQVGAMIDVLKGSDPQAAKDVASQLAATTDAKEADRIFAAVSSHFILHPAATLNWSYQTYPDGLIDRAAPGARLFCIDRTDGKGEQGKQSENLVTVSFRPH